MRRYSDYRFQRTKVSSFKFDLTNFIEYPKQFASRHKETNKSFVINLSRKQEIELQIVHPRLINPLGDDRDTFGFTIDLPFNTEAKDRLTELEKFKQDERYDKFEHFKSENAIEHYKCDCHMDLELLHHLTRSILVHVMGYNADDYLLIDHFFIEEQ